MRVEILVFLIILMEGTNNFVIEKREYNGEQKLLLRKLLSLQQNNSAEKSPMLNEILANVLVNKIILDRKQPELGNDDEPGFITKCFSGIIGLFKKYYWDRIDKRHVSEENGNNGTESNGGVSDPKDDIEVIEPRYHGRIENTTENINLDILVCPRDLVYDGKGNCIDPKNSKFIMAIPYQCPIGFRRDRLGYCRPLF